MAHTSNGSYLLQKQIIRSVELEMPFANKSERKRQQNSSWNHAVITHKAHDSNKNEILIWKMGYLHTQEQLSVYV